MSLLSPAVRLNPRGKRRPLQHCTLCQKKVKRDEVMLQSDCDAQGFISIMGIAHKQCVADAKLVVPPKPEGVTEQ
jgi:hypothetical protein